MWRLALLLFVATGCANTRFGGRAAVDARAFVLPAAQEGQGQGSGFSFVADPSFSYQSDGSVHTLNLQPFIRADLQDDARTHLDIRQADYVLSKGMVEFGLGIGQFRWGTMEVHRPTDVINQVDLVEDIEGRERLGQPYARVALLGNDWSLEVLGLPVHRPRTFPGVKGRLRGQLAVDDEPLYDQDLGVLYPSAAARFRGTFGDVDLGISAFSGIGREPRFFVQLTDQRINASYERLHHAGIELQWTSDAITLKFEGVARLWSEEERFSFSAAIGAERTWYDLGGTDLSLVVEYHMDNRSPDQPFTLYNNDIFAGFRLGFNDDSDTSLTAGAVVDLFRGTTYVRASASRRLHEHWRASIEAHAFFGPSGQLESALRADHFFQGRIAYFF